MTEQPAANAFRGRAPDMIRSDVRPLLRLQLVELRRSAEQASGRVRDRVTRAHFADVVERIDAILEGKTTPPVAPPAPGGGGAGPPAGA
jgi:hypothetical protein